MRTLCVVDGRAVTEEEASEAIKNVVSSHLTLATLLTHAYNNVCPLPSLSVLPVAQACLARHSLQHITSTEWSDTVGLVIYCCVCLIIIIAVCSFR